MNTWIKRSVALAIAGTFAVSSAYAQQYVYPAKGQSPDQQKKDEAECTTWAQGQAASAPAPAPAPAPATTASGAERTPKRPAAADGMWARAAQARR